MTDSCPKTGDRPTPHRRLRLLVVIPSLASGGTETQLMLLFDELCRREYRVAVALFVPDSLHERRAREMGVQVFHLADAGSSIRSPIAFLKASFRLKRLTRHHRIPLVYSFGRFANIMVTITSLFSRTKIVWGVRHSQQVNRFSERQITAVFSTFADAIVANSDSGRRACLESGLDARKVHVIENGIDTSTHRICRSWRDEKRSSFGLNEDHIVLGAVGRIVQEKDHDTLLRAFALILKQCANATLLIIGTGNSTMVEELKETALNLGIASAVVWLGQTNEVNKYMNAMDVFISTSTTEGFPNVVAEAMANGVPCVVTDVGDSATIVGDLGTVVRPRDINAIADSVVQTIEKRPTLHREELHNRIEQHYSIPAFVDRTLHLLNSVAPS